MAFRHNDDMTDAEEDTQKGKYFTFSLGKEGFGIEIRYVTEIIGMQTIAPIPQVPAYMKGIMNLRGQIIPVMDVRLRFGKEQRLYDDRTCIIVIDLDGIALGLIVDSVTEVITIADERIVEPPQLKREMPNRFIEGIGIIGGDVKLLLDCKKLIHADDADFLTKGDGGSELVS